MKKIIISLVMILGFSGCAVSGANFISVAKNVGGMIKTYKDTKAYLLNDRNSTKEK